MSFEGKSAEQDRISVILVDDSSVIRSVLRRILESDPEIKVIGSVSDGQMAIINAKSKKPDVIIMDVEMPVMDGLTALPEILKVSPDTKIVMCSSLTEKGAQVTLKAMSLGAVDCVVKPSSSQNTGPGSEFHNYILTLVKSLRSSHPLHAKRSENISSVRSTVLQRPEPARTDSSSVLIRNDAHTYKGRPEIIAIGSSTGGPQALFEVMKSLKDMPVPIVITQHMPATFTKILAEHIRLQSGLNAFEAEDGMLVEKGNAYVARGGKHMLFEKKDGKLCIKLNDGPQENFCKPAVDPMYRSLIEIFGPRILAVILTGMGQDGLEGAKILVEKGGRVIAQDQKTSVVWGMPGAVATHGLCSAVLPLAEIGPWIRRTVLL